MGCSASKLDNEDTVRRCKERRRLMKEAVHARHHLAAAHSDYCRSLRLTGSALVSFAAGEHLSVSDQAPAVFIHSTTPSPPPPPAPTTTNHIPSRVPQSPSPQTPPPPPIFARSPSPSPTIASSKLPHILSGASSDASKRRRSRKKPPPVKLPHILSESSQNSSPRSQRWDYPTAFQANSTYSSTPSQTSSVWNWENFYPPSPPDSEFFEQKARNQQQQQQHHLEVDDDDEESLTETETGTDTGTEAEAERMSEYDFFNSKQQQQQLQQRQQQLQQRQLQQRQQHQQQHYRGESEREEVQCSEWGDHYSTTSSSNDDEEGGVETRSEIGTRSNFGSESLRSESLRQRQQQQQQQQQKQHHHQQQKRGHEKSWEEDGGGSSSAASYTYKTGGEISMDNMKMVVRHKDLKEIVDAIKDYFDKAAVAGDQVSEMLEIGRAQLDKSFRQLKSQSLPSQF